jgi:hypothetical protein
MRWLKRMISLILLLVAAGVIVATGFSEHSDDYGRASLPQGGTVHLPEGTVTGAYRVNGDTPALDRNTGGVAFQVVPVAGGTPIAMTLDNGQPSEVAVQRSETIGELGAVAKLDVPSSGDYFVSGSTNLPAGSSFLEFGTNAGAAVLAKWHLLAGLVLGAFLIALIPTPRPKRRWEDEGGAPTGWSSDPRAPYAG